jgi:hypothetical protein
MSEFKYLDELPSDIVHHISEFLPEHYLAKSRKKLMLLLSIYHEVRLTTNIFHIMFMYEPKEYEYIMKLKSAIDECRDLVIRYEPDTLNAYDFDRCHSCKKIHMRGYPESVKQYICQFGKECGY